MSHAPDRIFVDHCCELLASVGPCTARRMFGGWGIATGGLNIALILHDTLYLKANDETRAQWLAAGGQPFTYAARGAIRQLGYFSAPVEALDDEGTMAPWARLALQAALAARSRPSRKSRARQVG